jgi:hypothetical protein
MKPIWKRELVVALSLLLLTSAALSTGALQKLDLANAPKFTPKDRELITAYYLSVISTLAPGSIDRAPFDPSIERGLAVGSHVPPQLGKLLESLPEKLDSQLTLVNGDFRRFKLGRHVLLVRKADLAIADILKNVALK